METYIHYGHKSFDKNRFIKIENKLGVKPKGGFWASNVNAYNGWRDWCESNDYRECAEENSFKFTLSEDAKVCIVNSKQDLENLPKQPISERSSWEIIDFEKLKETYDAIEINISKDYELYYLLYGWDCDSILIMNPNIIEPIN